MKKSLFWFLINLCIVFLQAEDCPVLSSSPTSIECFKEIATQYGKNIPTAFNALTPQERVFIYYLFRASLPANRIFADQMHRDALEINDLFEFILHNEQKLFTSTTLRFDVETFVRDVKVYLVYLWTNHCQYFLREQMNEKRTPGKLDLIFLTPKNLIEALQALGYPDAEQKVTILTDSIFNIDVESTLCVAGSIEKSSTNFYARDFTDRDFDSLPIKYRTYINSYYYIAQEDGLRIPKVLRYKIGEKYTQELEVVIYWLEKAYTFAKGYPEFFDEHLVASLEYLIIFLETGDEEFFKKHSIEWLQSKSRVDYTFGFIETYKDPKQYRGAFEADITVKSIDIQSLNAILPRLEKRLPFPDAFKRSALHEKSSMPNASINTMIFGAGELGPLSITAAYCLPNYEEIRAEHGSKQIIYHAEKGLAELLNHDLCRKLFNTKDQGAWLAKYDPEGQLFNDIWNIHCVLHETLGHGSGRLDYHVFKEGDPLTIGDHTYAVGDRIQVTSSNINEFIGVYNAALEELRAEVIALYTSIFMFDDLAAVGLYKDWPEKIGKEELIKQFIFDMARTGLRRLKLQPDQIKEISGAHAQANVTILYYLIDGGGLELIQEEVEIENTKFSVLGFSITDLEAVLKSITNLTILVQTIKSTADGQEVKNLIDTYGRYVRNSNHIKLLNHNWKKIVGDLKVTARVFPRFIPVVEEKSKEVVDILAAWPSTIIEQYVEYSTLALSKNLN